jgi:hypothetical protein
MMDAAFHELNCPEMNREIRYSSKLFFSNSFGPKGYM